MKITHIKAREIIDSRGNPTIETDVILENGLVGRAAVPSGASTGKNEALELRDNDKNRFNGLGVLKAMEAVNKASSKVIGMNIASYSTIDQILIDLDGTDNKYMYGANAILSISMACAKAYALSQHAMLYEIFLEDKEVILPVPLLNIINGGAHANNKIDFQEFMICPISAPSFAEAMRMGCEVYYNLRKILEDKNLPTNIGDEGGFAPNLDSTNAAIELILQAIEKSNYKIAEDFYIAIDAAASEFFKNGKYHLTGEGKTLTNSELISFYDQLIKNYPIFSIEDPIAEQDDDGWKEITALLGKKIQIVGDDVFVTNPGIFKEKAKEKIANSILIKPNQIGTIAETKKTIEIAKENSYSSIMSHRSGETEDTTISHLAVGMKIGQIKAGAPARSERCAKYNELIRIENLSSYKTSYFGKRVLKLFG